jgi:hypothetical protein
MPCVWERWKKLIELLFGNPDGKRRIFISRETIIYIVFAGLKIVSVGPIGRAF